MTVRELFALWIGVVPGHFGTDDEGAVVIRKMQQGRRFAMLDGSNLQVLSCDHKVIGYGHVIEQIPLDQTIELKTADHEELRRAIKKKFEQLGVYGNVVIGARRITPLDGHDVHD